MVIVKAVMMDQQMVIAMAALMVPQMEIMKAVLMDQQLAIA